MQLLTNIHTNKWQTFSDPDFSFAVLPTLGGVLPEVVNITNTTLEVSFAQASVPSSLSSYYFYTVVYQRSDVGSISEVYAEPSQAHAHSQQSVIIAVSGLSYNTAYTATVVPSREIRSNRRGNNRRGNNRRGKRQTTSSNIEYGIPSQPFSFALGKHVT